MRYWDRSGVYFVVENGEDKKRNYKFITRICLDNSSMLFSDNGGNGRELILFTFYEFSSSEQVVI